MHNNTSHDVSTKEHPTYNGSYSVLEHALYEFASTHYAINIYDDIQLEEFYKSTCHLFLCSNDPL